jgi:hypothetical protein
MVGIIPIKVKEDVQDSEKRKTREKSNGRMKIQEHIK